MIGVLILARHDLLDADWLEALGARVSEAILDQPDSPELTPQAACRPRTKRLTAGTLSMDLEQLKVFVCDTEASLTHQEFLLLKTFLQNTGRVLSRGQLLELAWDLPDHGEGRTVDVHVRRLRVKLGASAPQIETVRGFGYRFALPPAEPAGAPNQQLANRPGPSPDHEA